MRQLPSFMHLMICFFVVTKIYYNLHIIQMLFNQAMDYHQVSYHYLEYLLYLPFVYTFNIIHQYFKNTFMATIGLKIQEVDENITRKHTKIASLPFYNFFALIDD